MKKIVLAVSVFALLGLSSCGSASPEDKAKEVCECFEKAGEDEAAREKCGKMSMDALKSFKDADDKEGAKKYMEAFGKCQ